MHRAMVRYLTEKEVITDSILRRMIGILSFFILTTVGAFLYLPLPYTPVPLTLQTFFVLCSAAFLRKNDALLTQCAYFGLGALGLPIFSAGQGGLFKLFGPTGGYILGFIFSVSIVASLLKYVRQDGRFEFVKIILSMACGIMVIYLCGGLWLFLFLHFSLTDVLQLGIIPFIAGDILKILLGALIYKKANMRLRLLFQ